MKGYVLDIKCCNLEVAKQVEAGLQCAGSGSYGRPDEWTFRVNINPLHAGIVIAICQSMARSITEMPDAVKFYHDGQELS